MGDGCQHSAGYGNRQYQARSWLCLNRLYQCACGVAGLHTTAPGDDSTLTCMSEGSNASSPCVSCVIGHQLMSLSNRRADGSLTRPTRLHSPRPRPCDVGAKRQSEGMHPLKLHWQKRCTRASQIRPGWTLLKRRSSGRRQGRERMQGRGLILGCSMREGAQGELR